MRKVWQNFLNKVERHKTMEPAYWNYHQLLGYWCERTGMPLEDKPNKKGGKIAPRHHHEMLHLYDLAAKLYGLKFRPNLFSAEKVKHFLDWCINILEKKRIVVTSLNYLLNSKPDPDGKSKTSWVRLYQESSKYIAPAPKQEFNSDELDIPCEIVEIIPKTEIIKASSYDQQRNKQSRNRTKEIHFESEKTEEYDDYYLYDD